jgi:phospholipid-binding lipoprotein MlaA
VKPAHAPRRGPQRAAQAALVAVVLLMAGCASVPAGGQAAAATPGDPWESWNRKVYSFNDKVDEAVLKPVATAYRDVLPEFVRTGVNNVLGNIGDVWSAANQLLQGKVQNSLEMGMRVLTNSFFGLGGLLDPATPLGLTRRSEDFGQTLGTWGLGSGPFLVLPLLGPSTLRDTAGLLVDRQTGASTLPPTPAGQYSVTALEVINLRANLLSTTRLLDQVALDRYSFVRDAYLARRRDALYDGAPPMESFDDGEDEPAAPPAGTKRVPAKPSPAASR